MNTLKRIWHARGVGLATAGLLWLSAGPLAAQAARGASLRPYAHIFIAYAAAWILVVAWLIHIARRLRRATEDNS